MKISLLCSSRTISPEENCPPTPKLTLTQSLTLTEGQCFSGEIVCLPPNPKTKPNRKTPTLTEGQFSSRGEGVAIFRIPFLFILKKYPENFAFSILRILKLYAREVCKFLISRLIFILFYCCWMFVNKLFTYLTHAYLKT